MKSECLLIIVEPGKAINIEAYSSEENLSLNELEDELKTLLKMCYSLFGLKAFAFEFSGKEGLTIKNESYVGAIRTSKLALHLLPKIPTLTIEKCLSMAFECNTSILKMTNGKISSQISDESEYSPVELIAFSLLEAIDVIVRNGISLKFEEVLKITNRKAGEIVFQDWIQRGLIPPPTKMDLETTEDILPNRVLVEAIQYCLKRTKNDKIKTLCQIYLNFFPNIKITAQDSSTNAIREIHYFSFPRPDYEKALHLAYTLLNNSNLQLGSADLELPSVIVDLDKVFEEFCSNRLLKHLSSDKFEIHLQKELSHPAAPKLSGFIKPDIIIKNKKTNKTVVIDLKNKYSKLAKTEKLSISNADIYQVLYYSKVVSATHSILVYPGINCKNQFPIKSSESDSSYNEKISKYLSRAANDFFMFFPEEKNKQNLLIYEIEMSGPLSNTIKSLVSLCLLIERITE